MGFSLTDAGGGGGGSGLATFRGGTTDIELALGQSHTLDFRISNTIVNRARDFGVDFGTMGSITLARDGAGTAVLDFSIQRVDAMFNPEGRTPHSVALTTTLVVAAGIGDTEIIVPRSAAIEVNQRVAVGTDLHRVSAHVNTITRISGANVNTTTVSLDGYHTIATSFLIRDTRTLTSGAGFNIRYDFISFRVRGDISNVQADDRVSIRGTFVGIVASVTREGLDYIVTLRSRVPDESRYDFRAGQAVIFSRLGEISVAHDAGAAVAFHNPILETVLTTEVTQAIQTTDTQIRVRRSSLYSIGDTIVFSPTVSRVITDIVNDPGNTRREFLSFTPAVGTAYPNNHRVDIQSTAHSILVDSGVTENAFVTGGAFFSTLEIAKTESVVNGDVLYFPTADNDRHYLITSIDNTGDRTILTIARMFPDLLPDVGSNFEIRHYAQTILRHTTVTQNSLAGEQNIQVSEAFSNFVSVGDILIFNGFRRSVTRINAPISGTVLLTISPALDENVDRGAVLYLLSPYGFVYDDVTPSSFSDVEVYSETITIADGQNHVVEIGASVSNNLQGLALRIAQTSASAAAVRISLFGGVVYPDWENVAANVMKSLEFQGVTAITAGDGLGGGGTGSIVSLFVSRPVPTGGNAGQILTILDDGTLGWANSIILNTDSTIAGEGTEDSPYRVATPYTATEKMKLGGIEESATQDQTASEIRDLLAGLSGDNRLPADAIRDIIKTYRGDWSSGVAVTKGDVFTNTANNVFFALNSIASSTTSPESDTTNFVQLDGGSGTGLTPEGLAALIEGSSDDHSRLKGTEDLVLAESATELEKISIGDLRSYIQGGNILARNFDLNSLQAFGVYHIQGARTITNGPEGQIVGTVIVGEIAPSGTNVSRRFQIAYTQNSAGEVIVYKRAQTNLQGDWGSWSLLASASTASGIQDLRRVLGGSGIVVTHSNDGLTATVAITDSIQDRLIPSGGGAQQYLGKASGNDFSVTWFDPPEVGEEDIDEPKLDVTNNPTAGYVLSANADDLTRFTWIPLPSGGAASQDITIIQSGNLAFSVADNLGDLIDARNGANRTISITLPDTGDLDSRDLTKVCDIFVRTGTGGGAVSLTVTTSGQLNAVNPYRSITYNQDTVYLGNSTSTAGGGLYTVYARAGSYVVFGAVRDSASDNLVHITLEDIEAAFEWVDNGGTIQRVTGFDIVAAIFKKRTNVGHPDERWVHAILDAVFNLKAIQIGANDNPNRQHNYALELKDGAIAKTKIRQILDLDNLIAVFFINEPSPHAIHTLLVPRFSYLEDANNPLFPIQDGNVKFTIPRDRSAENRGVTHILVRSGRATGLTGDSTSDAIAAATVGISANNNIYHETIVPVNVPYVASGNEPPASITANYYNLYAAGRYTAIRVASERSGDVRVQAAVANVAIRHDGNDFIAFHAIRGIGG